MWLKSATEKQLRSLPQWNVPNASTGKHGERWKLGRTTAAAGRLYICLWITVHILYF